MPKTIQDIYEIVDKIEFKPWKLIVFLDDERPCLQVVGNSLCAITNLPIEWKGRKWFLSFHMTTTEIVQTAFFAVKTAMEHEVRETFKYKGQAVYGPHIDIDLKVKMLEQLGAEALEVRK